MESSDLIISPVKWFRALVPKKADSPGNQTRDLMSHCSDKDIRQGLLICAITRSDTHIFALFPSYVSFAKFHLALPETKRCFFEIILGDHAQKPHFDIEIEPEKLPGISLEDMAIFADNLLDKFLETMIPLFEELYQVELNLETDLLIFTSHGPKKRSFHVIIDNYSHNNNREAKAFYKEVLKKLPEELCPFIDEAVYSKKQQFRVVGSQKKDSGRIKVLLSTWKYQDRIIDYKYREEPRNPGHRFVLLLEASLVSYPSNCKPLTNLLVEEDEKKQTSWDQEGDDLHPETIKAALNLLGSKAGVTSADPRFPYSVRGVMGTLILLKRESPSKCRICKEKNGEPKVHEHENPYILVVTDDNKIRHVYFDCRRADGKKLYLGVLPEEINGKYLPDAPCLQEAQDILARLGEVAKIPMKTVREIKRNNQTA